MNKAKIHIYFVPGLAAGPKIFEFMQLSAERYQLHFLEWIPPVSADEPIGTYACRMAAFVKEKNPVLIGVSFGGIIVQEMSKHLEVMKVIIISSVKTKHELPKRLQLIRKTKLYKLLPTKVITNIEDFSEYAFGDLARKRVELYKQYLSVRDERYLNWAVHNVLNWERDIADKDVVHIHGENDQMFPIKHIENCHAIPKGTHVMILTKAKIISSIIEDTL